MCTIYLSRFEPIEHKQYQAQHSAGLRLLSYALANQYNILLSEAQLAEDISKKDHGKPFLKSYPDIHYNISHCDNMAACVLSNSPVGIDIEMITSFPDTILRKVLTEQEKSFLNQMSTDERSHQEWFFRLWTLKESRIKHSGLGLTMPLTDFSFTFDLSQEPYQISCSDKELFFTQQVFEKDYIISLCTSVPQTQASILYI